MNLVRESPPSSWTAMAGGPTSMAMEADHTSGMFLQDEDRLQSPSFNLQSGQGYSSVGGTLSDLPVSGSPRWISDVDLEIGRGLSNQMGLISMSPTRISDVEPQAGIGPPTEAKIQPEHIFESPMNEEARQGLPTIDDNQMGLISTSPTRISDVEPQAGIDPPTVTEIQQEHISESSVNEEVRQGLPTIDDNQMGLIFTSPTRISDVKPRAEISPPTVAEIQPEHISESSVNEETRQDPIIDGILRDQVQDLSRPSWRCTPFFVIEAFDLFVDLLVLILESSQVMIINSKIVGWVVLGFNINSCLTKLTLLVWSTRRTSAPFVSACFFLPNGQKYIEPSAAIMQVIFSAASIIVKFPWRIILLQLLLSTAMVSSKVTMICNRICHSF